jgi:UrcA family protein
MATKSISRRRYWQTIAGLLCVYGGIASSGFAAEVEAAPPQEVVRIGDLNLLDSRGIAAAYGRLFWAAQRVCAGADSSDYWVREGATPCLIGAVSRALDRIGAPQLTAYAQAQPLFRLRHIETVASAE